MSSLPQGANPRTPYGRGAPSHHVFRVEPPQTISSPAQGFPRQLQGGIRPQIPQQGQVQQPKHNSPYNTPYLQNVATTPRNGGSSVGVGVGVSAEQQIAQGVLSNASAGSGTNTPQRRPPPLGTTIHMPGPHGTAQNGSMGLMGTPASINQAPRQTQNASPALLGAQRQMNGSPANALGRPQDNSPDGTSQDLSLIDPQLAIDQQLADPNGSIMSQGDLSGSQQVMPGELLSPPPGGSFPTFDALFAYAQNYALQHGYAFVIGRSKRDNRGLKKVFLICDRGGTNKEKVPGEQRQRKTKSRKCGCEFGVFGLENKTAWLLRGRIDGEHLTHNHPPSDSPTEHPGARKLDPKAIAAVKALEENGVSVKETLEILHRENPTVRYLPRDIYNARAAIKRDPSRVDATATQELPTFYKKPPMTFEEKLRAELRTEVANAQAETEKVKDQWKKEVEALKEELRAKDKQINKFEMFIDICNERVMVQRERLAEGEGAGNSSG